VEPNQEGMAARGSAKIEKRWRVGLIGPILRRTSQRTACMILHPLAVRRFETLAKKADNLEKAIDLAYSFRYRGIHITPCQDREEISEFCRMVQSAQPKVVLEIGPENGGTLFALTRVAGSDGTLISLDLPAKVFGMGHPGWADKMYRLFPAGSQKVHILRGDSHQPPTVEVLKQVLAGREIDLLFIDGDHSYEGVKADFEMYSRYVRKGGMVALHDILPLANNPDVRVSDFWSEVKDRFESVEIVKPRSAGGVLGGIGILRV